MKRHAVIEMGNSRFECRFVPRIYVLELLECYEISDGERGRKYNKDEKQKIENEINSRICCNGKIKIYDC